jgi:hypothetical protein
LGRRRLPRCLRSRRGRGREESCTLPSVPLMRVESATIPGSGGDGCEVGGRKGRGGSGGGLVGFGDINEQSWLRSASGSTGYLGLGEEKEQEGVVDDGYGHGCGTLVGRDGLRPRSGLTESLGGGWRATFRGRRAAALAWEQRRREERGGDLGLVHVEVNAVEDPAGLGAVESVMRELVLSGGTGDETRGADIR